VPQRFVALRAEAVVTVTDRAGRSHRFRLQMNGRTATDQSLILKTRITGDAAAPGGVRLQAGECRLYVQPRVNADDTVSLDATGTVDFTWRAPGLKNPLGLYNQFAGTGRVASGRAMTLTDSSFRLASGTATVLLTLTPRLAPEEPGARAK
jgi:type 1 fimbria pilin